MIIAIITKDFTGGGRFWKAGDKIEAPARTIVSLGLQGYIDINAKDLAAKIQDALSRGIDLGPSQGVDVSASSHTPAQPLEVVETAEVATQPGRR
jgi:hypothetical protein